MIGGWAAAFKSGRGAKRDGSQHAARYAARACSLTPSARATFSTVAKLGFPSSLSAR
jgi:hypothetical protein